MYFGWVPLTESTDMHLTMSIYEGFCTAATIRLVCARHYKICISLDSEKGHYLPSP